MEDVLKSALLFSIISIIAVSAIVGILTFRSPITQLGSITQQTSSPQVQVAQIREISTNPSGYSGKNVQTEGSLRKDFSLMSPYILSDGKASLFLKSNSDMDEYVGLNAKVTGLVKHDLQSLNTPATWVDVQSIQPIGGGSSFYVGMEKHGVRLEGEDFGYPTLDRLLVYDNSGTLTVYAKKSSFLQRTTLTKERVEEIRRTLLAADIFYLPQTNYTMKYIDQGDTFTYRIKVIMRMGNELKVNQLWWEEPSYIPEKLQKLEATFNNVLKVDSP